MPTIAAPVPAALTLTVAGVAPPLVMEREAGPPEETAVNSATPTEVAVAFTDALVPPVVSTFTEAGADDESRFRVAPATPVMF
jgi:hypothetical protein